MGSWACPHKSLQCFPALKCEGRLTRLFTVLTGYKVRSMQMYLHHNDWWRPSFLWIMSGLSYIYIYIYIWLLQLDRWQVIIIYNSLFHYNSENYKTKHKKSIVGVAWFQQSHIGTTILSFCIQECIIASNPSNLMPFSWGSFFLHNHKWKSIRIEIYIE